MIRAMKPAEAVLFIALISLATCTSSTVALSTSDVLEAFRNSITADPTGALATWSTTTTTSPNQTYYYCSWEGIVCRNGSGQVKGIQLANRQLKGSISPLLGHLSSLSFLDLSFNHLAGNLPMELSYCTSLTELTINDNQFITGSLPAGFANLTRLQLLSASNNQLSGELPPLPLPLLQRLNLSTNNLQGNLTSQLANCQSLRVLDLSSNAFTGAIPASLGNLSHLGFLELAANFFSDGLPPSLANCSRLYHLNLYKNALSGPIPSSWFPQLRHHLAFFSLGQNGCNGSVPSTIALCSKLEYIELGGNHFEGQILHSILNCTKLSVVDLWTNSFSESLPTSIGSALPHLTVLGLVLNHFYGTIPSSLSNCSGMTQLILGFNYGIKGSIPNELFRLQQVIQLDLQHNELTGSIPLEIGNTSSRLQKILFNNNHLSGSLPSQLGLLPELQQLNFEYNQFSGEIPSQLSNCTYLFLITGHRNLLQGQIPSSLGKLKKLEHLTLDNNQLSGVVPSSLSNCTLMTRVSLKNNLLEGSPHVVMLPNILYFDMSNNRLSGSLSQQIGAMTQVQLMDISNNNLSGYIPTALASCVNLFYLNLSSNRLSGPIPSQLADSLTSLVMLNLSMNSLSGSIPSNMMKLASLQKLDLSFNNFSGEIPSSLSNLANLSFLNLSYNNLQGEIPDAFPFQTLSPSSFIGNPSLCSLKLLNRACRHKSSKTSHTLLICLVVATAAVLTVSSILFFLPRSRRKILSMYGFWGKSRIEKKQDPMKSFFLKLTLQEILEATDNFSPANVLGKGGTGVVYKGITKDGKTMAFKKLNLPRSSPESPFFAEVHAMAHVKHRNLVRILGYFSDLDNDILILEYMPNGNLDQQIHDLPQAHITAEHTVQASQETNADLHDPVDHKCLVSWHDRVHAAKGVAEGLAYLHHDCYTPIIHLDIKPTNILLDQNHDARITDFGLARIVQESLSHISVPSQHMRGTLGYTAPEYAATGRISTKCDVYSFGVLLLETLTGKSPTDDMFIHDKTLASWVLSFRLDDGNFGKDLLDLCVGDCLEEATSKQLQDQANSFLNVGLLCAREDPKARPTMREVVEILTEGTASPREKRQKSLIYAIDAQA